MKIRYWLIAILVVLFFGVVGQMDYEDGQSEQATYCENVKLGVWPDFKNIYEKVCKTLDEQKQRI